MGLFKAYIRVRTRRCVGRVSLGTTLSLRICQPRPPPTRSFPTSNVSDESSTTHLRRKPVLGVLVDAFSSGAGLAIQFYEFPVAVDSLEFAVSSLSAAEMLETKPEKATSYK